MTFAKRSNIEKQQLGFSCPYCGAKKREWCIRARRPRAALLPAHIAEHLVGFPVVSPDVSVFRDIVVIPKAIRTFDRAEYLHRQRPMIPRRVRK